jgi:hypothetical protein
MESKTNFNLKKGDPCRVRLHDGRVVEAVYDGESLTIKDSKRHWVIFDNKPCWTVGESHLLSGGTIVDRCRFVGPSCDLMPL